MDIVTRTDRGSGKEIDVYKCSFCGLEINDPRPNPQIKRD
jgi:hypothetical protein